jgi:hypothetical protein
MSDIPLHGDPDGMRALASTWLARAQELGDLGAAVAATMTTTGFAGPAAARLTRHADALRQEEIAAASALHDLAEALMRDARLVDLLNAEAVKAAAAAAEAADAAEVAASAQEIAALDDQAPNDAPAPEAAP